MSKIEWQKIGEVGVDSGQLMLCDPSYLGGWEKQSYKDLRVYSDKEGRVYAYDTKDSRELDGIDEYFANFESVLENGKTPNQCNRDGEWTKYSVEAKGFNYNAICHRNGAPTKQINYAMGHAGLAVAFSSGLGDGCYDVMAKIYDGRVLEVKVVMSTKEEVDQFHAPFREARDE